MADRDSYLVGTPELSELLMRSLQLKGDLPQFVETPYNVGIQIVDLTQPEWVWLRRWKRVCARSSIAASPGNFTGCYLATSAGNRRTMAVLEALWIRTGAANPVRMGIEGDVLGVVGPASPAGVLQDDRAGSSTIAGANSDFGVDNFTNAASPLSGAHPEWISGGTNTQVISFDPSRPIILTGKPINNTARSIFYAVPTAVNIGIDVCFFWRERPLLETEL